MDYGEYRIYRIKKDINTFIFLTVITLFISVIIFHLHGDSPIHVIKAQPPSIVVGTTVIGQTSTYIGATEAGGFYINDLIDLGINVYRLWTDMSELEWWDDDDSQDGLWDDSEYGSPTIDEIKADAINGFVNTIPWTWWDDRFDEVQSWRYGVQTRRGIIEALIQNGITPLFLLRTYNANGQPEQRPGAEWAPRPPVDTDFRNEWWEHCFAITYWLNVRNNYGITHFEVLNEPDYSGQGWSEYGGTINDYVQLVLDAYDAVGYANSFSGLPVYIHAPDVANYNSSYVSSTLDNADSAIHGVDYHSYSNDVGPSIIGIRNTINNHNPDGILEPIWNTEWGALWSSYNTFNRAMTTANQLFTFSNEGVEGVTIFNMYDWITAPGNDYGLIDLQDDGSGGANRFLTETYYAYRLMIRGLIGGKDILQFNASGVSGDIMVTRDSQKVYIIVKDSGSTIHVDASALGILNGSVMIYEYSSTNKDVVVANPIMVSGQFSFTTPISGISLAEITPVPGRLEVTPQRGFNSSGMKKGGPFDPISQSYRLKNSGELPISWTASNIKNWVNISKKSGNLSPDSSQTITILINKRAEILKVGNYRDTITFTNLTNGNGNTYRNVNLIVTDKTFNLVVKINPSLCGSVRKEPDKTTYTSGESVMLTGVPHSGYVFDTWSGDVPSGHIKDNPLFITMDSDKVLTAHFYRIIHAPLNFTGQKVLNRSLLQIEYINVLSWKTNPDNAGNNILKYRIYFEEQGKLNILKEVNSTTFEYMHRKVKRDEVNTYVLKALNSEGREGIPARLTIQ